MKGTVSVISSHPPCKDVNSRFTIFYCKISENLHMDIFTGTFFDLNEIQWERENSGIGKRLLDLNYLMNIRQINCVV